MKKQTAPARLTPAQQELTPWFPASVKPARPGVYQVTTDSWPWEDATPYSYWDGERFNWVSSYFSNACKHRYEEGAGKRTTHWRGLAQKPEGAS